MLRDVSTFLKRYVPGYLRIIRLPGQLLGVNPFSGDIRVKRVPLFSSGGGEFRWAFPHLWNYEKPIRILDGYFQDADDDDGTERHNRYLDVPGFAPFLVTRDPTVIRAIATETGDKPGEFDRDTLPSTGIARATGKSTLLYSNGALWRRQRKIAASPFGKTTLFQPEKFHEFAETFRQTVTQRLDVLREHLQSSRQETVTVQLEPEVKVVMLEMLVNNFFGADVPYERLRDKYVPALERVIDHIVRDTVVNPLGIPW